ncbi:MAG TPA: glycerophosphodiester phosphodiesterase family protein [Alphaproteobacteria bacterium]|nr:glycerophosphodiester phosphodiesterase family protein [Alphaproteobacteria bacterium]
MVPDWLLAPPVAHRGLHDAGKGIPENSLAAFAAAVAAGYGIELDVRPAADGTVMVFHDATLARLTGAEGRVDALDAAALGRLRLAGTDEAIPRFAEVLDLIAGRVPLLVELKTFESTRIGPLEQATLALLKGYVGPFAVQSFSPLTLRWFREAAPEVVRGQLSGNFERYADAGGMPRGRRAMLRRLMFNYHSRPHYISYDVGDLPYAPVAAERRAGRPVVGFTVRSEAEARRLAPYMDNMIFEGFRPAAG